MRKSSWMIASVGVLALAGNALAADSEPRPSAAVSKAETAIQVLKEIEAVPEREIPPSLLANAQGVAIFPGLIKVGLTVGGEYGTGVLLVRDEEGKWSNPVFLRLVGGSVGWQIGAQSTDVVLVFKTRRSVEGVLNGKFKLGADAAVAAGPVGRRAEADTDLALRAEILSYSRSRGLFAGVSLDGALLTVNDRDNAAFYGEQGVSSEQILAGKVEAPPVARDLRRVVTGLTSERPT